MDGPLEELVTRRKLYGELRNGMFIQQGRAGFQLDESSVWISIVVDQPIISLVGKEVPCEVEKGREI